MRKKKYFLICLLCIAMECFVSVEEADKPEMVYEETESSEPEVTIEEPETEIAVTVPATEEESEEEFVSLSFVSVEYQKLCFKVGEEYGISPLLLIAIMEAESGGDVSAINEETGCIGLMQLHPKYAHIYLDRAGVNNPHDPECNIRGACEILLEKFEQYYELPLVLMLYHGEGNKAFTRYRTGQYSNYCIGIMERMEEMQKIMEEVYE